MRLIAPLLAGVPECAPPPDWPGFGVAEAATWPIGEPTRPCSDKEESVHQKYHWYQMRIVLRMSM